MRMVSVEWEDATEQTATAWTDKGEVQAWTPCIVQTVGFVVHDHADGMVLTDSYTGALYGRVTQIPRGMIRSVTELRKARSHAGTDHPR